ncbi:MAG: beta-ketoacyl synthase N-terminal-like domain-containing protein [Planctomycetota bacterium]
MIGDHHTETVDLTTCGIAAWASVTADRREIAALRKNPGEFQGGRSPALAVKLADDQAVLALVAVLRAIQSAGWTEPSFRDWGVIAGPRYLARVSTANTLERFQRMGPRGVSPLAIPQTMLSAISGTMSVALGAQGLNCGVGGAPGQLSDALLVGLTLLDTQVLAGLWVVLTEWSTEPVPDGAGDTQTESMCRALALACTPGSSGGSQLVLTRDLNTGIPDADGADSDTSLVRLARFLEQQTNGADSQARSMATDLHEPSWSLYLGGAMRVEVRREVATLADSPLDQSRLMSRVAVPEVQRRAA